MKKSITYILFSGILFGTILVIYLTPGPKNQNTPLKLTSQTKELSVNTQEETSKNRIKEANQSFGVRSIKDIGEIKAKAEIEVKDISTFSMSYDEYQFDFDSEDKGLLVETMEALFDDTTESVEKGNAIFRIREGIIKQAANNTELRQQLVTLYESSEKGTDLSKMLLSAMEEIPGKEILDFGVNLLDSSSQDELLGGLKIISKQPDGRIEAVDAVVNLLQKKDDVEVTLLALDTLPTSLYAKNKSENVLLTLEQLSQNSDPDIRESSLIAIGKQARDMPSLDSVLTALNSGDKMAASVALYESSVVNSDLKSILLAQVNNQGLDIGVRQIASASLNRFSLNEVEYAELKKFSDQNMESTTQDDK